MTKRGAGSRAGAWVLSARFLAWARANGHEQSVNDIARARSLYTSSGAATRTYEGHSDDDLTEAQRVASTRLNRIEAEQGRRRNVDDEIDPPADSG